MAASGYTKWNQVELAWRENRERVTLQARQLLNRALNDALGELDEKFSDALQRGEVLHLDFEKKELRALLRSAAAKLLAP